MDRNQHTLKETYRFEGKGLHTGTYSHMTVSPAPAGHGIKFRRTDLPGGPLIEALAENVTKTARSTTISCGDAEAVTIEHIMSALSGLGVDNALVELDNREVPILDGSAGPYVKAFLADGLVDQGVPRVYIDIPQTLEIRDGKTGSWIRIEPADAPSADITVDFGSRILGVQSAHWDETVDYAHEIGVCRTFCFFHEIEYLFKNNPARHAGPDGHGPGLPEQPATSFPRRVRPAQAAGPPGRLPPRRRPAERPDHGVQARPLPQYPGREGPSRHPEITHCL